MAKEFEVPKHLASKWKLKIRDKERVEPPHVSVLQGQQCWRWGLRERAFLDKKPPPSDVPDDLVESLEGIYEEMCTEGDAMYPKNPVSSQEGNDDD